MRGRTIERRAGGRRNDGVSVTRLHHRHSTSPSRSWSRCLAGTHSCARRVDLSDVWRHPHFNQDVLAVTLARRNRLLACTVAASRRPREDSPNGAWSNEASLLWRSHEPAPFVRESPISSRLRTVRTTVMFAERTRNATLADSRCGSLGCEVVTCSTHPLTRISSWTSRKSERRVTYPPRTVRAPRRSCSGPDDHRARHACCSTNARAARNTISLRGHACSGRLPSSSSSFGFSVPSWSTLVVD